MNCQTLYNGATKSVIELPTGMNPGFNGTKKRNQQHGTFLCNAFVKDIPSDRDPCHLVPAYWILMHLAFKCYLIKCL